MSPEHDEAGVAISETRITNPWNLRSFAHLFGTTQERVNELLANPNDPQNSKELGALSQMIDTFMKPSDRDDIF